MPETQARCIKLHWLQAIHSRGPRSMDQLRGDNSDLRVCLPQATQSVTCCRTLPAEASSKVNELRTLVGYEAITAEPSCIAT